MYISLLIYLSKFSLLAGIVAAQQRTMSYKIIAGAYTDYLHILEFDPAAKSLSVLAQSPFPLTNPSWVATHPSLSNVILVASETDTDGHILTMSFDSDTNSLAELSSFSSGGGAPAHAAFSVDGTRALVVNYGTGDGRAFEVDTTSGKLSKELGSIKFPIKSPGPVKGRQDTSHPHEAVPHPSKPDTFYVPDLGTDVIHTVNVSSSTSLSLGPETSLKPASGPRHMAFHPTANYAYVICELSNDLKTFIRNDDDDSLQEQPPASERTILPPDVDPGKITPNNFGAAEVQVSPDGKYVYASNRNLTTPLQGSDTIAIFDISQQDGKLASSAPRFSYTDGRQPRGFILFGDQGQYLVAGNLPGNNPSTIVFERDVSTGALTKVANLPLSSGQGHTSFALVS